jgi:hypothetical protein
VTNSVIKYALGAVVIVAAVLAIRSFVGAREAEWHARVERETARAEAALEENATLREQAEELEGLATSLSFEAAKKDTVIVRMIEELPAPPADCEPFTAPRDSVIIEQRKQYASISEAYAYQRQATAKLRYAEFKARTAADSLLDVLADRPQPLSPLIPKVGLGATAGICTTGQPCVAVGLTLNWEVRLF